ncbi:MAG: helix-turn-helix domain-containing protein [Pirellulales bacterium]
MLLTGAEYALVELPALHRGKPVSRSMIYDHLFDENDDTLSNLIEVHVSNVCARNWDASSSPRRGQGYLVDG